MATAVSPSSSSSSEDELETKTSKEEENASRIHMLLKFGKKACLKRMHKNDHFSFSKDPQELYKQFQSKRGEICRLSHAKVLYQDQVDLLLPPTGNVVDTSKFDITLLMVVLVNFCGFKYPRKNYVPQIADMDDFSNLVRIKHVRDKIKHNDNFKFSDDEFQQIVHELLLPLLNLGISKKKIFEILTKKFIDKETKDLLAKYEQSQFNHNYVPPVSNFCSRDAELSELHDKMIKSHRKKMAVVLCGLPGVGKSQIAMQYWQLYGSQYYEDIIIWINAENKGTIEKEFREIGEEFGIQRIKNLDGSYVDTKKLVDLVYRHFAVKVKTSSRKILFIFDGADDIQVGNQFLPKSIDYAPYILITSQCKAWGREFDKLDINVFEKQDALKFFIDNTSTYQHANIEDVEELLKEISCHPLALQQAVSYITGNSSSIKDYIVSLKKMLSEGADQLGNPSVNATMTISINRLKEINQNAVDLLNVLSHLDGQEIKKGFLLMFFDDDISKLNKSLSLLQNFSIITFDNNINNSSIYNDQVIQIHSLTQHFLESCQSEKYFSQLLERIASTMIKDLEKCEECQTIQDGKFWLNHFNKLYDTNSKRSIFLNFFVGNNAQYYLTNLFRIRANVQALVEIFRNICEQQKQRGDMDRIYLRTRYFYASCLNIFGLTDEAFNTIESTITLQQQIMSSDDMEILYSKKTLANCLKRKGKSYNLEKAFQIETDVIFALINTNNKHHKLYTEMLHNMSFYPSDKNDYKKSIEVLKDVQEAELATLGPTHENYLKTKHNLAQCYSGIKDYNKSSKLLKEVEEAQLATLGRTHKNYLPTKHSLALGYIIIKDYNKSIDLLEEVQEAELATLGPTHESFLNTKHSLALCYCDIKDYYTSIEMLIEVQKAQLATLGPTHESYLRTKLDVNQVLKMENQLQCTIL